MVRLTAPVHGEGPCADHAVVWHDLECRYDADLGVWKQLADRFGPSILELGCGTGRLALWLAGRGCEVRAIDTEEVFLHALRARAQHAGTQLEAIAADVGDYPIDRSFDLVLAPMQLMQLLEGDTRRRECLAHARRALRRGGAFCAALAAPPPEQLVPDRPPLPDVCERDGWVFSSLPVAVTGDGASFSIERLRQAVSPAGELTQSQVSTRLELCSPAELEQSAVDNGFKPLERREVSATDAHVSSTVCVLEAR